MYLKFAMALFMIARYGIVALFAVILGSFGKVGHAQDSFSHNASAQQVSQEALHEVRSCFPYRERIEVTLEGFFEHQPELKTRHALAVDQESEARFYTESWVGRAEKTLHSREVLITPTHSFLSSNAHFKDGSKQLPKVILLDEFAPFHAPRVGDLIGEFGLFAGFATGLNGLESLHEDAFEDRWKPVSASEDFQTVFQHQSTRTSYHFRRTPNGRLELGKIDYPIRNVRGGVDLAPTWFELVIKDRNDTGRVTRLIRRAKAPNAKAYQVQLVDAIALDSQARVANFKHHPIEDGVFVIDTSGQKRVLQYWDGSPRYVVDPIAEEVIEAILGDQNQQSTMKTDSNSEFVRAPYLRQSADAAHCGIYSFAIAAAKLGKKINLEELVKSDYYAAPSGSSALQLVEAAEHYGMQATVYTNSNVAFLRSVRSPCLLHYGNSHQVEGTDHWVTLLSIDDQYQCEVVDLPNGPETFPLTDLMTYWDGTVIVLTDQNSSSPSRLAHLSFLLNACLPLLLLIAAWIPFRTMKSSTSSQILGLLLISGLLSIGWAWLSPYSFLNNSTSVHIVRGKVPSEVVLPESHDVEIFSERDVQIVDARLPAAYSRQHLEGAINIPVDCSLGEMRNGIDQLDPRNQVVVYCQSHRCLWGHAVGNRLTAMGFDNVVIYKPGWSGYVRSRNH